MPEEKKSKDQQSDDCPMCSIDEEMIKKLKKEAEQEKENHKNKKE